MKYLLVLIFSFSIAQAIITIVPVKLGDKPGVSGAVRGSSEKRKGNTDTTNISAGVRVQYDNNSSYAIWGDVSGSYGEANGEENTNKSNVHIRYIHTLYEKSLNWEVFVQSETNKFTKIDEKYLSGAGLRYDFFDETYGDLYLGLGGFYERIDYTTTIDPRETNARMKIGRAHV